MLVTGRRALLTRSSRFVRRNTPLRLVRAFALTTNAPDALTLNPSDVTTSENAPITQVDPYLSKRANYMSTVRQQKYDELIDCLNSGDANPDWIWTCYVDLLDFTRDEALPLEVHQHVLRKCTLESRAMRTAFVGRLGGRRRILDSPHRYEGRFLTVINNIRKAGYSPTLDDYDFILRQFAAVGHYIGAAQVLQEVMKMGLKPRTKTFGLCLQAVAFRLSLPYRASERAKVRDQCSQLCLHIASRIRKQKQRVPSVCLDLILRIMKDTENPDVFNSLLKMAYGIDLDYLDRHALPSDNGLGDPEPFSTAALTTLVDFLGRQKQVSKMVAAFEVLSTPPNVNPTEMLLRNFDDEDDDYPIPSSSSRPLPFAQPNTTTYNTLIRHCTQLRKPALAKHYTLQALALDYSSSARLLTDVRSMPLQDVPPPKVRVDIGTFRPILGLGNRNSNLGLVKWLLPHFRMALQRKKQDLQYYLSILHNPDGELPQPSFQRHPDGLRREYEFAGRSPSGSCQSQAAGNDNMDNKDVEPSVTFFTPSSVPTPPYPSPTSNDQLPAQPLDTTLKPTSSSAETRHNHFDLAVHVQVLQQDVEAMEQLDKRIGSAVTRLSIRVKEALGRRVWEGRPIYIRDVRRMVKVTREDWMEIVNFGGLKPRCRAIRIPGTRTVKIVRATSS